MSKARRLESTFYEKSIIAACAEPDFELDWSHSVRCVIQWTHDELLSHLCSKAFTVPTRDYKPSTPFVSIKTEDGLTTVLPHKYRLPLLFIAKYQWETTTRTLSLQNCASWEGVRIEILHLSRLCQVLFAKARAKAESGGMEKGWRCIMFDRALARFYKGVPRNSQMTQISFSSRFGNEEYQRDVLKHDWKRWVRKGVFCLSQPESHNVRLMEKEINDGISAANFKIGFSKIDNVWMLNNPTRLPIKFMQQTGYNSPEFTDLTLDNDEPVEPPHTTKPNPQSPYDTPAKRGREISEDDDNNNRLGKRIKLEEIVRAVSFQPCASLTLPDNSHRLDSGGVAEEEHSTLPNFRVPRQTLSSHGWKRLPLTDASARYLQHEEGAGAGIVPACSFGNSTASIPTSPKLTETEIETPLPPIPLDFPVNGVVHSNANPSASSPVATNKNPLENSLNVISPPFTSSLNEKAPIISLRTPNPTSMKSKKIQPKSTSTSAYSAPLPGVKPTTTVSIPTTSTIGTSSQNPFGGNLRPATKGILLRIKPLVVEPVNPTLSSSATERGGGGGGRGTINSPVNRKVTHESSSMLPPPTQQGHKALGAPTKSQLQSGAGDVGLPDIEKQKDKVAKGEEKRKMKNTMKNSYVVPWPLSSLPLLYPGVPPKSTTNDNKNKNDKQRELITPTSATTDTPLGPPLVQVPNLNVANSSGPAPSSSISSSSIIPPTLISTANMNGDSGGVVATAIGAGANSQSKAQPVKDRLPELKDSGGVIGRLKLVKGVGGDLGRGCAVGADGGSSDRLDLVSRTEEKAKENGDRDSNVEMVDISESGAMPVYVDAAAGVDYLVTFKDMCVQTDEPAHVHRPIVASTTTPVLDTDGPAKNLGPPPSQSRHDETFHQSMNTSNLSTIVDNLVSAKMLSMMQTLVKSSNNANNITAPITESDILLHPSPSSSSLPIPATHPMDAYDNIIANLLDELKTIKEEARCREQNEKEELLAMRQLHSAEVDALRRRLSYLESRNLSLGRWDSGSGGSGWRVSNSSMRADAASFDLDHQFMEDNNNKSYQPSPFRQRQFGDRSRIHHFSNGLGSFSSSTVNSEGGELSASHRLTNNTTTPQLPYTPLSSKKANLPPEAPPSSSGTPTITANAMTCEMNNQSFGFSKNGGGGGGHSMDLDDDTSSNPLPLPLPAKSQRKHHIMALARTHFS